MSTNRPKTLIVLLPSPPSPRSSMYLMTWVPSCANVADLQMSAPVPVYVQGTPISWTSDLKPINSSPCPLVMSLYGPQWPGAVKGVPIPSTMGPSSPCGEHPQGEKTLPFQKSRQSESAVHANEMFAQHLQALTGIFGQQGPPVSTPVSPKSIYMGSKSGFD